MNKVLAFWCLAIISIIFVNTLPRFFPGDNNVVMRLIIKTGVMIFFLGSMLYVMLK